MRYIEKEKLIEVLKNIQLEGWIDENINMPAIRLEVPVQAEDTAIAQVAEWLKKEARKKEVFDVEIMDFKTIYVFEVNAERLFGFAKEFLTPNSPFREELIMKLVQLALTKLELM